MTKVKVKVIGIAPLLMNRFHIETNGKGRTKRVYDPKEEAEKKAYKTTEGKLFLPNTHFKASLVKASTDFKMIGKKSYRDYIRSGIFIEEEQIILNQQNYEIHEEPVVIQRNRVMSWRPKFKEWSCEFTINIEDDMINSQILKEILESAGKYKGVGDHRPEYGRFKIDSYEITS